MGTRADFYVGSGPQAEWVGSIAYDGYPSDDSYVYGVPEELLTTSTEEAFRANLQKFFDQRDDVTLPDRGWPWPWNDSRTTDYSYWFHDGAVLVSCFGSPPRKLPLSDGGEKVADGVFPDMTERQNVRFDHGSGLLILGGPR